MRTPVFAALAGLGLTATVSAGQVVFTASWTFVANGGPDTLGLNGSTVTFSATFDDTDTYVDRFGFASILSNSDSLAISGSSGSDGTYASNPIGMVFYPGFSGQWFGETTGGDFSTWNIGTEQLRMNYLTTQTFGASIGDTIDPSHFSTTLDTTFAGEYFQNLGDGTDYDISGFSATVAMSVIPLPTASALAGVGLLGLGVRRRRCSL